MDKMYLNCVKISVVLLSIYLLAGSCTKTSPDEQAAPPANDTHTVAPTRYSLKVPPGFPMPYFSAVNPLTVEGVELGSRLYSDPILSSNGLSCSSCHQKDRSFSRPLFYAQNGFVISVPPHVNLVFKRCYGWEGAVIGLDTLCMGDFEAEFFNTDSAQLYQRLIAHPTYPAMFRKAFGIRKLDTLAFKKLKTYICYAISQHMRTMISASSKYDSSRFGGARLTMDEYEGMQIFFSERGDCYHCHNEPLFSDYSHHNNGLGSTYNGFDKGRALVTQQDKDLGKFLTPTLRNIELTAPYMHDGRFNTLEEVVEFYNSGVTISAYSDPVMNKRGTTSKLNLTQEEKQQLVAFLKTLTDKGFVK